MYLHAAAFIVGWCFRSTADPTRWQDLIIFASVFLWNVCKGLGLQQRGAPSFLPATWLSILTCTLASLALLISASASALRGDGDSYDHIGPHPLLLPSHTTHTRLFPKKHSFSYSYLQVSIPLGFEGRRCGALISVGQVKRKGWFHVQASDYLHRHSNETTFKGKLTEYLVSQVN
jgi:hypothetical protein